MARPFTDILREMSGGRTVDELTERVNEVVEAAMMTRRRGEVVLKISVKPNGDNAVTLSDKITVKVPEDPRGDSIFFVKDGDLTRKDPRQPDLPLRRVGEPTKTEEKEAANG